MCMFTEEVDSVDQTRIYIGKMDSDKVISNKRLLVYEMQVKAKNEVAMVLPVPAQMGSEIEFINMEDDKSFFRDLYYMFAERTYSKSLSRSLDCDCLEVFHVGNYIASVVKSSKDFDKLDPRFRLPSGVLESLPYKHFYYVVFQLQSGSHKYHPMAFTYYCMNDKYFIPTLHLHDGKSIDPYDDYDHILYVGSDFNVNDWKYSLIDSNSLSKTLSKYLKDISVLSMCSISGSHVNGDVIIDNGSVNHKKIKYQQNEFYENSVSEEDIEGLLSTKSLYV